MKSQLKRGEVNLSAQVRDLIEADITTGLLRPGQKLDETQLSDKYGVSRTPVREALKHLASKGLVDLKTNRGAYVRQISLTTLIEMFETMSALESARGLKRRHRLEHFNQCGERNLPHIGAAIRFQIHQTFRGEVLERLANRRSGDTVLVGQLCLVEFLSGSQQSSRDVCLDEVSHLRGEVDLPTFEL